MLLGRSLRAKGRLSCMARRLGLCSQVVWSHSDWAGTHSGGERCSADGDVPGARRQRGWLRRAFAGCHGGQVADGLFLPLRD